MKKSVWMERSIWAVLLLIVGSNAMALVSTAPVQSYTNDGVGNAITSTGAALDINIKSGSTTIGAGSAIIGKVGIDQTTPGTTNGVQVNAALPAGTNLLGKTGIDQTTPGTTNAVSIAQIGATTVSTGNGVAGAGVQRVTIASDNSPIPVSYTSNFQTRSDTFTTATTGTTVDVHLNPLKTFSIAVKKTSTVTSWTVVLEGSLDNTNWTTILTHTNVSPGDGSSVFSGTSLTPVLYFRSNCTALTLGGGTNVVATILGM